MMQNNLGDHYHHHDTEEETSSHDDNYDAAEDAILLMGKEDSLDNNKYDTKRGCRNKNNGGKDQNCSTCNENHKNNNNKKDDDINVNNDGGDEDPWPDWCDIPVGAQSIVQSIVAQRLVWEGLNHFGEVHLVDFQMLEFLFQKFPNTCHHSYPMNWYQGQKRTLTPLAILCSFPHTPLSLLQLVYRLCPTALNEPEPVTKALPLDYACSYQAPLQIVKFLVECDTTHLHVQTARHERLLPLHLACHFSSSMDVIQWLLQCAYPRAMDNHDSQGWYPLHAAAGGHAPLSVIQLLHEARPQSALAQDSGGFTPLHLVCCQPHASVDVVRYLVQVAPQALLVLDVDALSPLFRAVRNQTNPEIVQQLLQSGLDHVALVDGLGGTLLHHAVGHNHANDDELLGSDGGGSTGEGTGELFGQPPPQVLATMANTSTFSSSSTTRTATRARTPTHMVEYLCHAFPTMIRSRTTDHDQFQPLHVACMFGSSLEVIQALVQQWPASVHSPDSYGRLPTALASHAHVYNFLKKQEHLVPVPSPG